MLELREDDILCNWRNRFGAETKDKRDLLQIARIYTDRSRALCHPWKYLYNLLHQYVPGTD